VLFQWFHTKYITKLNYRVPVEKVVDRICRMWYNDVASELAVTERGAL
jgi:hypothetical protein